MNPRKKTSGLTLLEVLVAVIITVIVGGSVMTALYSGRTTWQTGDAIVNRYQNARAALDFISRDLQQAFAGSDLTNFQYTAGVLYFTKLSGDPAEGFDVKWVEYRLDEDEILRAEYELGGTPDPEPLAWNIKNFSFRFYDEDGNEENEWRFTDDGKLPARALVKVTVTDSGVDGGESDLETEIFFPLSGLIFR